MGSHTCQNNSETEKGALFLTVLVIISALILIGSLVISIVVTERNISRNHKMAKDAFYLADAGYPITVSIIEAIAQQREEAHEAFSTEPRLRNEVMDYYHDDPAFNDRLRDSPEVSPDVRSSLFGQTLFIDVDRTNAILLGGGSAGFAAGGGGIGFGGGGSTSRSSVCACAGSTISWRTISMIFGICCCSPGSGKRSWEFCAATRISPTRKSMKASRSWDYDRPLIPLRKQMIPS